MKQKLTKKLFVKKVTIASLNKEAEANVFGGNMPRSDDSCGIASCLTDCIVCAPYTNYCHTVACSNDCATRSPKCWEPA